MAWGLGRIGAAVGTLGGSEAYRALSKPGQILGPNDVPPTAPADPGNAQYGAGNGTDLSNQLASQAYGQGLQQQQGQSEREGAFYNQANGNFDIANAAQMRGGPQISSSTADKQAQLAALGGTNAAIDRLNTNGNRLGMLGTRPMGASYADAQLHEGLNAGMAQQLSMAHSGRSLGSGAAALNQAAFNNAGLSQQTNQAAASARIQEQNAYHQFQLGALGAAGQQYSQGGALAGQAGNQATTIRSGNEGVQAQNAALDIQQQQTNNQTTGLYNQLGAQEQGYGMQANGMGQGAYQFGAQRNDNIMGAQLQANTGLNGINAQVNMANNQQANASETAQKGATLGLISDGAKAYATAKSDYRSKTNIQPMEGASVIPYTPTAPGQIIQGVATEAPTVQGVAVAAPGVDQSRFQTATPLGVQDTTQIHDPAAAGKSYLDAINAYNAHYAPSQRAPVDVLNHVPGAGAGPSGSQASLLSYMRAQGPQPRSAAPVLHSAGMDMSLSHGAPHLPNGSQIVTSDVHSKTRIKELESQLSALGATDNKPQASQALSTFLGGAANTPMAPDTAALDQAYARQGQAAGAPGAPPAVDLTAARGYAYDYKDPHSPGAAPGRQVGPMAQDLENTAAASTVHDTAHGKQVDTGRLAMVNTAAISELQRKLQQLEALGGGQAQPAAYDPSMYPQTQAAY